MTGDSRALSELLEESQDLQADALRPTHAARLTRSSSAGTNRVASTSRPTAPFTPNTVGPLLRVFPRRHFWVQREAPPWSASWPPPPGQPARPTCRSSRRPPRSRTWPWAPTRRRSPCPTSAGRRPTRSSPSSPRSPWVSTSNTPTRSMQPPNRSGARSRTNRTQLSSRWSTRRWRAFQRGQRSPRGARCRRAGHGAGEHRRRDLRQRTRFWPRRRPTRPSSPASWGSKPNT